ncbi:MAG: ABC transporter ATP-binding protein [Candidatus Omnitrophota bacterium]
MSETGPALIRTEAVSKIFPQTSAHALEDVSLSIAAGEFVVVRGPSGSGKSTLLNILAGLIPATSGTVYFQGVPFSRLRNKARFRRENIGFVFQDFYLYPGFTVAENIVLPLANRLFAPRRALRKAQDLLAYLGMEKKIRQNVNTLSSGERQRVCIARAMLSDPPLILADEPTGCLDTANTDRILTLLQDINKNKGAAILMVTHDDHVAARAQRQIVIVDGKIHYS